MGEFNPAFSFEINDRTIPSQTPWDFSGMCDESNHARDAPQ